MLCVTGNEKTVSALKKRIERTSEVPGVGLQEIRLDALTRIDDEVFGLLKMHRGRTIACCRPVRQGGYFKGSESERLEILERAILANATYLDIEIDTPYERIANLFKASATVRRIFSIHDFESVPQNLKNILFWMAGRGANVAKIAAKVDDAADLQAMLDETASFDSGKVIIGMGAAGLLSRTRFRNFGSAWTYVHGEQGTATAPGQLSLETALLMGLPASAEAPFLTVVGGDQVVNSPGVAVYNRIFRKRNLPYSYQYTITSRPVETFKLLKTLGALGAGVTMPHKKAALDFSEPDELSRQAGAANTLLFSGARTTSTNTDILGISVPMQEAMSRRNISKGARVIILGSGGAAMASAAACRQLNLEVHISARDREKVSALFGDTAGYVPWVRRLDFKAEILINATPLGGGTCPWPDDWPIEKEVVFDTAIAQAPSKLLEIASAEGAEIIGPMDMWVHQGAAQMTWMTGMEFSAGELRENLP
jgi:3-dehydroquinate dehydratase type I